MAKKKLIKAFGDRYSVLEHDGGYVLYDKERQGKRNNYYYIGKFYINTGGDKYSFMDGYYADKDALISAIEEYNKTLPFDAENFAPIYRKNYVIESCLDDYLTGLGFKREWGNNESFYVLKDAYEQKICTISIKVEMDTTNGKVARVIPNSDTWTEAEFTDLESAIGACNSIIGMYCLAIHAKTTNLLKDMTKARCSSVLDKTFNVQALEIYSQDTKEKTIEYLEAELKRLKGLKVLI